MSDYVIKVENLGKAYTIRHQQEQYTALRDVMADTAKRWGRRLLRPNEWLEGSAAEKETFWALKDVSFEVKRGERLGIIGSNGAGKSTLLKVLSRITEPTRGEVRLRGRVASLLEVGTGFHPELTGRENIYLNSAILGMSRAEIERKFDEIVAFAEVEKFLDTPVKRYSSGMYVRLAFAVAAHLEPEILLVDEVLAVGDIAFQQKSLGKMDEVSKSGRTVLFVSHNMGMIHKLCEKAIMLQDGSVCGHGETSQIIDMYLHRTNQFSESLVEGKNTLVSGESLPVITIDTVELTQNNVKIFDVAQRSHPIHVRIGYTLTQRIVPFRIKIRLFSVDGTELFHSDDTIGDQSNEMRQSGSYFSQCTIPANLLNTTEYFLEIGADSPRVRDLIPFSRLPSFMIINTAEDVKFRYPGVIHPGLYWQVIREDA